MAAHTSGYVFSSLFVNMKLNFVVQSSDVSVPGKQILQPEP
jgi:hypothetical protein